MVAWADVRFAHRFAGGPAPTRPTGGAYTRQCWGDVLRTGLACAVAAGIAWTLVTWIGHPERTDALHTTYSWAIILPGVDALWTVSHTLWPRRERPASTHRDCDSATPGETPRIAPMDPASPPDKRAATRSRPIR
ncbi:hypothetical protein [Leekyejoonella antrihumi]|uniref:Uncharacterized protein n=1 Tax=Leekyejoonella antrihumi TaxID=1660198 RepID=A0A563DRN7_9MICO|nr:hypothetical protein [Leekyejoonella antrihumi]TWP32917.1 hypothetical protein FGL98_23020 [Leekyejoonella antrihumi]